ncbi:interferon-stimulated 20 kDa exonuclease-like 2 isoform X2 [Pungitius pungitius]|uniref:interferon-stimulated 20 kDa exonuclease-like 2 isoform X2 n=1 Tax=Pungitius pungitius TaxID=134920 RepID=UPI002E0D807A
MSDISLNLSYAGGGAARRRPPRGNRGGHKRFPNRTHQRSFPGRGHAHRDARPEHGAPPRQNGAFAQLVSSPGGALCGHRAPSSARQPPAPIAGSRGCGAKPGEPAERRPAPAAAHRPSPAESHRAAAQTSARIPTKYLALDCEMVGTGPKGSISKLARCSLVSYDGDVVYDKFINPPVPVTDYRTRWSGIRRSDLVNAAPYSEARKEILRLLMGKVVIGHAVHNDFNVLGYSHPAALTRDTSRIPLLNQRAGFAATECASLKRLTKAIFNRDIQTGKKGHSSVEDARATMELYKVVEEEWERTLASSRSQ